MAQEEKESLSYAGNLARTLNNFRKDQINCDATLVVEGQKFHAHRNILAASSSYFYKLFAQQGHKKKKSKVSVVIPEISLSVTEELMQYLYTGFVELTSTNVQGLIRASIVLDLVRLKDLGCEFLQNELNLEICVRTFQFADKNHCLDLRTVSKAFINENFRHVSKTEAFLRLTSVQIEEFISDDDIVIDREEDVYEATLNWVKHDAKTRSIHFSRLFQHIRLTSVSKYYLHTNVGGEELVKGNRSCIDILLNAMKVLSLMSPDSLEVTPPFIKPRKCLQRDVQLVIACGVFYQEDSISSTLCYNTLEHMCYQLAPVLTETGDSLHCRRWGHGMAECNGFVYIMGGFYDDTKQVFSDATSAVQRLDVKTNKWSSVASLKKPTALPGVAVHSGCLYVVGGSDNNALKDVQKYFPETDVWEMIAPLGTSRCALCAVADKDHVFALGGLQENGKFLNTAEMYDPKENRWDAIASLNTARAFACCVADDNKILVVGGSTDILGHNALSSCEMYDTCTGVWTQIASMHIPRFAAGVATVSGRVYVFGGSSNGESFRSVESYSAESNEWRMENDMLRATAHLQCTAVSIPRDFLKASLVQSEVNK